MIKYVLTLLACAAMLYQGYASAANLSKPTRSRPKVEVAQQVKNAKLAYHPKVQPVRKRCQFNDQRAFREQRLAQIRKCAGRRGNFDGGNTVERGGYDNYYQGEGRGYDRYPEDNRQGRDFSGATDYPGESNSEESFLGDHR